LYPANEKILFSILIADPLPTALNKSLKLKKEKENY